MDINSERIMKNIQDGQQEKYKDINNELRQIIFGDPAHTQQDTPMEDQARSISPHLQQCIANMNQLSSTYNEEIPSGSVGIIKRGLAKLMRWYVRPNFDRQMEFNAAATSVSNELMAVVTAQQELIAALHAKIEKFEQGKS